VKKRDNHSHKLLRIGASFGLLGLILWSGGLLSIQPVEARAPHPETITGTGILNLENGDRKTSFGQLWGNNNRF
jgi:hypothetical protein